MVEAYFLRVLTSVHRFDARRRLLALYCVLDGGDSCVLPDLSLQALIEALSRLVRCAGSWLEWELVVGARDRACAALARHLFALFVVRHESLRVGHALALDL